MVIDSDKDQDRVFASLADVGTTKPLGYLPLDTLKKHLAMNVGDVAQTFEKRGLVARAFPESECCIRSGALYVYDRMALQRVLDDDAELLKRNDWPVVPERFVEQVSKTWIESAHPIHRVIRRAFGELV